jgi:hypothetical protein
MFTEVLKLKPDDDVKNIPILFAQLTCKIVYGGVLNICDYLTFIGFIFNWGTSL